MNEWLRRCWLCCLVFALAACAPPGKKSAIEAEPQGAASSSEPEAEAEATAAAPRVPEPSLHMPLGQVVVGPDRRVPILIQNTDHGVLRRIALGVDELAAVLPQLGVHPAGSESFAKLPRTLRLRAKAELLPETRGGPHEVDVFADTGASFVLALLEAPGALESVSIFQRGELSVLLKVGGESGLVWVTATRTGKPVPDAEVVIQQGGSSRFRARTDREGIARLPAERRLRATPAVAAGEGDAAEPAPPLVAIVTHGKDVALVGEGWSTGIDPWAFQLPESYFLGQDALRGSVNSERGIYRPGESVHLLGVLRRRLPSGKLVPPSGTALLHVSDPDGNEIHSGKVALTEFGTFRGELAIAKSARLGRYSVWVEKDHAELRSRFEVGEYRPRRFEVTVPPVGSLEYGSKGLELPLRAAYFYGAPVAKGQLTWTLSAREKRDWGAWAAGYDLGSGACGASGDGEGDGGCDASASLVEIARGDGELDADGKATIAVPTLALDNFALSSSQALELVLEANVKDAGGDVVAAHSTQTLLRAPALIGLASDDWVVDPKHGWNLRLLVAGADGAPRAGQAVNLRLIRHKWVAAAEQHDGRARYQGEWQDETIATQAVTSATQASTVHFALPLGGEYRVEAELADHDVHADAQVWAYGADAYGAWGNTARMELRADKTSYRPGERARLYADAPYPDAWALITTERSGVLAAHAIELSGAGTPIEIPIGERDAPNVFASVAVVPAGLAGKAPAAGPPLRIGYRELVVSAEQRHLTLDVRPAATRTQPSEPVDVRVRVSDAAGRPVRAEVTLWAADEGVLALTGYATPDPFVAAYQRHFHQVRTAASLLRFANDSTDQWDEYGGDGAPGRDGNAAFRSRFLGTAFFSQGLVTDARGEAVVKLPLPDNLTRWRVMAAAADNGERFGASQSAIETWKPVQIEPALPRFLTRGDRLDATVLVHNQTAQRGEAEVRLSVSGAKLEGSGLTKVVLEPGAQVPLHFPLDADAIGSARVRASVTLGGERDAFQIDVPVNAPTPWQTELIGEGRIDGGQSVTWTLPASAEPGLAELIVTAAPGVLASIGSSIDALREYPNGCVEQTTSRLIPMVLLEQILRSSGDTRLSGPEQHALMEHGIAHVLEHQNPDGGFGLWPHTPSEGFLTAYALWGLLTARDHGYEVPPARIAQGLTYLRAHDGVSHDMHGQFAPEETQPFAAFVLASAQQDDGGLGLGLSKDRKALSEFGLGLLGAAFAERKSSEGEPLLRELAAARTHTATGAVIAERAPSRDSLFETGGDLRATAAAVRALVLSGKPQQADDLIAGILDGRGSDGSWGTTYNNLWALHALVDYAEHGESGHGGGEVKFALDGAPLGTLALTPHARYRTLAIDAARLPAPGGKATLSVSAPASSALRYSARLRWASAVTASGPADHGFSLERELVDAETGVRVDSPRQGQLLRVRLTVKSEASRKQVALVDRLPAGFEPIDTAFGGDAENASDGYGEPPLWIWRELHDERVTHFANELPAGTHTVEYLVRATRAGTFLRPAPSAEMMYSPEVYGHGAFETVTIRP